MSIHPSLKLGILAIQSHRHDGKKRLKKSVKNTLRNI